MKIGEPFNPFNRFNGIYIPTAILHMPDLSPRAQICYGRLMRYAGKNGECFPAVKTLAAETGVGERQAQKCLAELQQARLIRKTIRPGTTDLIEFLWHEAFESPDRGVKDNSSPGVHNTSPRANDGSPQGCTKVHPKRVTHHHQEENHSQESASSRDFGRLGEKPFHEGGDAVLPPSLSEPRTFFDSPEEELIAFAEGKGQPLTRSALQSIREALELRGVTLERFVDAIRPQFGNKIKNPAGFLLDRARKVRGILDAARPPNVPPKAHASEDRCEECGEIPGRGLIRASGGISPCPTCATPEFRAEFSEKEAQRQIRSLRSQSARRSLNGDGENPDGRS